MIVFSQVFFTFDSTMFKRTYKKELYVRVLTVKNVFGLIGKNINFLS